MEVNTQRQWIKASYIITPIAVLGLKFSDSFLGSLVSVLGIALTFCVIASPFVLFSAFITLKSERTVENLVFSTLAAIYFFAVVISMHKLWPAMMGV